jgi:hypothetical protein
MEADVEGLIGASRHERLTETRLGTLSLRIPKLRDQRLLGGLAWLQKGRAGILGSISSEGALWSRSPNDH